MTISNDENPYRPTGNEEPVPQSGLSSGRKPTLVESVVVFLIALAVAIPVFFATCIGGSFALMAVNLSAMEGEGVLVILFGVSLVAAAFVGGQVGRRWLKNRTGKSTSGDTE